MRSFFAYSVVFYFFMFIAIAHATPYAPQIDFRDGSLWSDADKEHSYSGSQSGVDLTISAAPIEATLWWDDMDGLGIRLSYENDEVESEEVLRISFHDEVALLAIYISDLFVEDGYSEKGSYRINDGAWVHFDAMSIPGSNDNGERLIAFGSPIHGVDSIDFSAPGKINHNEDHEFALMGLDVSAILVPEPNTALLLSMGLWMVGLRARRR